MPAQDPRYLRHNQIEGFSQPAVSALKVLVIGAGAIGNEVVKNLALLGVGRIDIYDLDRVEVHNLTRSVLLRETDIGSNKAIAVAARARELDPALQIHGIAGDIHDTLSVASVRAASIVLSCTDNFEARIRVNQLCLLTATPWVNTGIDARYGSVETFAPDQSADAACYECTLPASVYQRMAQRRSCGGLQRAALAQQVMPTTTITTSITAGFACNETLRLSNCDQRSAGKDTIGNSASGSTRIFIDTIGGTASRSELSQASLCPGCGLMPRKADQLGSATSGANLLSIAGVADGDALLLSDRIIWRCACETCGPSPATSAFELQRAGKLSDMITLCPRCGQSSVKVDIREQFTVQELVQRYANQPIPAAWALRGEQIIELNPE